QLPGDESDGAAMTCDSCEGCDSCHYAHESRSPQVHHPIRGRRLLPPGPLLYVYARGTVATVAEAVQTVDFAIETGMRQLHCNPRSTLATVVSRAQRGDSCDFHSLFGKGGCGAAAKGARRPRWGAGSVPGKRRFELAEVLD